MPITKEDLQDFQRFADRRLDEGVRESLVMLAGEWEARRREMDETIADIHASHADIEAGRVSGVADAFAEVRKKMGQG
jgi:hypothetical protein